MLGVQLVVAIAQLVVRVRGMVCSSNRVVVSIRGTIGIVVDVRGMIGSSNEVVSC